IRKADPVEGCRVSQRGNPDHQLAIAADISPVQGLTHGNRGIRAKVARSQASEGRSACAHKNFAAMRLDSATNDEDFELGLPSRLFFSPDARDGILTVLAVAHSQSGP